MLAKGTRAFGFGRENRNGRMTDMVVDSVIIESWPDLKQLVRKMPVIVVYDKPNDFPDKFVARLFDLDQPTVMVMLDNSLHRLRKRLPMGLIQMQRSFGDDSSIVETWI